MLDSKAIVLISSEFARKQEFKLKKIKISFYKRYRENTDWCNKWVEVDCNLENTMACSLQFWDWLENRGSQDDKLSKRVWKVVETKAEKIRMIKEEEKKGKKQEEKKKKKKEEKTKDEKNNECEKYS